MDQAIPSGQTVSLREEGVDLSACNQCNRVTGLVSLREEGVDLSFVPWDYTHKFIVSLREEGVDLSLNFLLFPLVDAVSLREEGVDLSLKTADFKNLGKRLPPRGGSGFKQGTSQKHKTKHESPSARREWI